MDNSYIQHFGIKGQHWGVRRFQNKDGSLTEEGKHRYGDSDTNTGDGSKKSSSPYMREDGTKDMKRLKKEAAEDAKEYARAKAYYGEGAGTRRKKIKNKISEKMKDPDYESEFKKNLENQDMAEHQKAANRERKTRDTANKLAKIGRGVKNLILGVGTLSVPAIIIYNLAKSTGADKKIEEYKNILFSQIGR